MPFTAERRIRSGTGASLNISISMKYTILRKAEYNVLALTDNKRPKAKSIQEMLRTSLGFERYLFIEGTERR